VRPTEFASWSTRDRGLAEALIAWEDSLCPGCGNPRDQAWDPRSEGEWEAHKHRCEACAEKARATDGEKDDPARFVTVGPFSGPRPE
jgi:hypothetical protein